MRLINAQSLRLILRVRLPAATVTAITTAIAAVLGMPEKAKADFTLSYTGKPFDPSLCRPGPTRECPGGSITSILTFSGELPENFTGVLSFANAKDYGITLKSSSITSPFTSGSPKNYQFRFDAGLVTLWNVSDFGLISNPPCQKQYALSTVKDIVNSSDAAVLANSNCSDPKGYVGGNARNPGAWSVKSNIIVQTESKIVGLWRGFYFCSGKKIGVDIDIHRSISSPWEDPPKTNPLRALLSFYPAQAGGAGITGSFGMNVLQGASIDRYNFVHDKWISNPPTGVSMFNFQGATNSTWSTIIGNIAGSNACTVINVSRFVPDGAIATLSQCKAIDQQITFMQAQLNNLQVRNDTYAQQIADMSRQAGGDTVRCGVQAAQVFLKDITKNLIQNGIEGFLIKGFAKLVGMIGVKTDQELLEMGLSIKDLAAPKNLTALDTILNQCKIAKNYRKRNELVSRVKENISEVKIWQGGINEAKGKKARLCPAGVS